LVWGRYNPSWLTKLSAAEKRVAMLSHIGNLTQHYGSDCYAWDVVNEALTDNGGAKDPFKDTDWYPDVKDYVDVAFTAARKMAPKGVKLFYNDYNVGSGGAKSDRLYNMVKVQYTVHSTLYTVLILYCTRTLLYSYSTVLILYSTQYTIHCTHALLLQHGEGTVHSTLYTVLMHYFYNMVKVQYSTQYTIHCTHALLLQHGEGNAAAGHSN
jgi:hypothetical protein